MKLELPPEKKQALKKQHKQERDGRVRDRIKAVLLYSEGWSQSQIAHALIITPETVHDYLEDYSRNQNVEKPKKEIKNLNEFEYKKTFKLLYERLSEIEKLKNTIESIRGLPIDLYNALFKHNIDVLSLIYVHTKLAFVLYRSMFQSANWEEGISGYISPDAYSYDEDQKNLHDEILKYVDWVLAHQDIIESSSPEEEKNMRGVYPQEPSDENENKYLTYDLIKYHAHELSPLINLMKEAIKNAYFNKFEEPFP
jgi:predicted transcriptional regulator